ERATCLDDRANLMTGVRYDYVDNHSRNFASSQFSERQSDEVSYQLGANFRVIHNVTVFANTSRSFVPQFRIGNNLDGTTFDLPNEFGEGWEIGAKAGFFDNHLTFTATYYDI